MWGSGPVQVRASVVVLALALAGVHGGMAGAAGAPPRVASAAVETQAQPYGQPWDRVPTVLIAAAPGDPRIPLVLDAVAEWNQRLQDVGTPFRLGPADQTDQLVPSNLLVARGAAIDSGAAPPPIPDGVWLMPGDIVVALSSAVFVSFTSPRQPGGKVLVGIRAAGLPPPMNLPNVARNVILHELGHAIGLGHNSDATALMCGRPAPCRPDAFQSSVERYFPLTDAERALLASMYPPTWSPTP